MSRSSLRSLSCTVSPPCTNDPQTLLFLSTRSTTFRSAICSHRAQLFPKPLCIYMSTLRPPSARVHSVQRDASEGLHTRLPGQAYEERREMRVKERTGKDTAEGENLLHTYDECNATTAQATCNTTLVESPVSTLQRKSERGRKRKGWEGRRKDQERRKNADKKERPRENSE